MKSVPAHQLRLPKSLDDDFGFDKKYLILSTSDINETPFSMVSLGRYALGKGAYELVILSDRHGFMEDFKIAHLSYTWNWRALVDSGPHEIVLPGASPFVCGKVEPNSDIDLGTWLQGIYIAMILRDIPAVKVYGEADPEWLAISGQNKPDHWKVPYIKFLNGIWAFDTNIGTYLKDALKGADPGLYTAERADYLLNIISPVMELWATVFTQNPDRFNQKLYEQQRLRHDWHSALGEESGNTIMEYIDLAALAAVCHAHDKGFKIEVQSDYLPEFLINGDFPKLEWPDPEWKEWPKA